MIHSQINPVYVGKTYLTREWFHEKIKGKDNLLITIGDSWTWGDSLGEINMGKQIYDDYNYRINHVYGQYLSVLLDTDWVNIGIAGGNNLQIIHEAHDFIQNITKEYKKIFVVITLTEVGRELLKDYDSDTRLSNLKQEIKDFHSLDDLLIKYEAYTFNLIKKLFPRVLVGRNFTRSYDQNKHLLGDKLLPKIWTDIIAEKGKLNPYPEDIRILSLMGIDPVLEFAKDLPKEQLISLINNQEQGFHWLKESPYNSGAGTKHPNEQAHRWWAKYLYQNINL